MKYLNNKSLTTFNISFRIESKLLDLLFSRDSIASELSFTVIMLSSSVYTLFCSNYINLLKMSKECLIGFLFLSLK
jgi:hypothetical protein